MNVPLWGGLFCCFGAALRACGALPRAPACWERSANRVLTPRHAEAFGTPSTVPGRDHSNGVDLVARIPRTAPWGRDRGDGTVGTRGDGTVGQLRGWDRGTGSVAHGCPRGARRPCPGPARGRGGTRSAEGLGVAGCQDSVGAPLPAGWGPGQSPAGAQRRT